VREAAEHTCWQQHEDMKELTERGVIAKGCQSFSFEFADLAGLFSQKPTVIMDAFLRTYNDAAFKELFSLKGSELSLWSGQIDTLVETLEDYIADGWCCQLMGGTKRGALAILSDLQRRELPAVFSENRESYEPGKIFVIPGVLSSGLDYPEIKLAILSYGRGQNSVHKVKSKKKSKEGKAVKDIADLIPGDYVVHTTYGIGIFDGIVKKDVQGITKDYIKIRYAGTDLLFVPVTQLDLVSKYIGGREQDGGVKLSKLNSPEWHKTRQRVKSACANMAKELIALYASRMTVKGFAFSQDSEWQKEFEQRFEFEETDDQLRCAAEIKADMEKPFPMERLLCGDVGFGKTEVALRAIFKCVLDGKQCAVMVPTTILAWQHYQTFLRRLEGYPITVELLSRFRTPKQQKEIIKKLREGRIDIVVGTHRLIQKDVHFKDLGLCIIDEEQRFGVAHKEKFKEMRGEVDLLTLSATPIPRTLNMAMSGIRDMSVIDEAPQDRYPVQTYVLEYDAGLIAEAMRKEIRRGGQVFYLHNRIDSIESCMAKIRELIPDARIVVAHGRMSEEELSEIWKRLIEREIDILVCTTIIESGIDVPNCNTLIVEDADMMGLSQLYQLRGRVGRSGRRAYAYFTFRQGRVLTEIGEKRLASIKEFTSFGSGFRIAMRDLEIRGAGDILGAQQHGHMEAVGYDLYLKLLSDAISEQKGIPVKAESECTVDLPIGAHIPESYISSLSQRIDVYKKIAAISSREDYMDCMDELIDRFGDPPSAVVGLLDVALTRGRASRLGVTEINQRAGNFAFHMKQAEKDMVMELIKAFPGRIMVSNGSSPCITVKPDKKEKPINAIGKVLDIMENTEKRAEEKEDLPVNNPKLS